MLLDTNIIVDLFREYKPAVIAFDKLLFGQSASVMTELELIVGEKTKNDVRKIIKILENLKINFLQITPEVSEATERIILNFHHSKGIGIQDAFIAATALEYDEELVTRNTKHFDFIPNLKLIAPYK